MIANAPILAETSPASWTPNNGGRHRTEQIHGILECAGISIAAMPQEQRAPNLRRYLLGLRYLFFQTGLANGASFRLARRYGGTIARAEGSLRSHNGSKVLLWEISHPNNLATAHLARNYGFEIIAAPHNIESIGPGKKDEMPNVLSHRLTAEVRALARAKAVFCISREEQWLLSLYGIAAHYLPYYPPAEVEQFLLNIRSRRAGGGMPQRFLMLGSCINPPTAAGMMEQIRLLKALPNGNSLPIDIAGGGTELLQPQIAGTNYNIHGAVDRPALAELLLQTKAMLIHQRAAVGALTRIPEALIAGVPIIANPIAARSAIGTNGVRVYETSGGLFAAMNEPFAMPNSPQRPTEAEELFVETTKKVIRESR